MFSHLSSRPLSQSALQSIIDKTASGDNKAVNTAAKAALESVNKSRSAIKSILKDMARGGNPEVSEYVSPLLPALLVQ